MGDVPRIFSAPMRRVMSIGAINGEARTIELSFSSDAEIERCPGIVEILSHDPGACDLSRLNDKANLLFNHDPDHVLGVVESARVDTDGRGRAIVRFGKSEEAERAWRDVQDGILSKVSVSYLIKDGKSSKGTNDYKIYTANRWQPYEISLVTIPADASVGVGRNLTNPKYIMETTTIEAQEVPEKTPVESRSKIDIISERNAIRQSEQDRTRAIIEACEEYGVPDIATRALKEGKSVDQVKEMILKELSVRSKHLIDGAAPVGLNLREIQRFSCVKLVRHMINTGDTYAKEAAAFEIDACNAAARQISHRPVEGKMIPLEVMNPGLISRDGANIMSIAAGSGFTGTGGALIPTAHLAGSFIEALRNNTILLHLSTTLGGLFGYVNIPKMTSIMTASWVGEGQSLPKQSADFGVLALQPKRIGVLCYVTEQLMSQASPDVEAMVRNDLAAAVGDAIDKTGFYGDGTQKSPVGIKHTKGINRVKFADASAPTYRELASMVTPIPRRGTRTINAKSMAYVANSLFEEYATTTQRVPKSASSDFILREDNWTIRGHRAEITDQIQNNDIFCGYYPDLLFGFWGGFELKLDPYSGLGEGVVRLRITQDSDMGLRYPKSFTYGSGNDVAVRAPATS